MYREYKHLNLPAIDAEILQFWQDEKIFEQSVAQRPTEKSYVFYEGPPSANGKPGIHHVMARTVKDIFCRYSTLKGYRVERKGGWDTHGLPIELQVEKELGITKEDIGKKISVDDYNHACRSTVMRYKDLWDDITRRMGYWVDLDNPYITFENNYIESVWWLLKRLYDKKTPGGESYLYKGFTIQPFSPAAGTGLSTHELNMPGCYREVTDISVIAMFKVRQNEASAAMFDSPDEDVRILAWTTTPWTLPSNVALTVGPEIEYVKVQTYSPYNAQPVSVVLAKDRLSAYFNPEHAELPMQPFDTAEKKPAIPYRVVKTLKGKDLAGMQYEQLLPYVSTPELEASAFRVITGDFVTTEDGTGVVHTAPYFGADDMRVAREAGIPMIGIPNEQNPALPLPLVDRQGKFVAELGEEFGGRYVKAEYYPKEVTAEKDFKSTDLLISLRLKEDNKAFKIEKYAHNYPHCWRTDKPVLYYPLDSWFVRASAAKERMSELNKTINWQPESTGTGRFGQWLDNLQDWNLSRSRYWGVPLPIWRTEDGDEELCVGSVEELSALVDKAVEAGLMAGNPYGPTPSPTLYGEGGSVRDLGVDGGHLGERFSGGGWFKTASPERWKVLKMFARDMRKVATAGEAAMWEILRDKQLGDVKFRRQHAIEEFIADFVSLEYQLVVEVDGTIHNFQPEYDQMRTELLNAVGFEVVRFTNEEAINQKFKVIDTLRTIIKRREAELSAEQKSQGAPNAKENPTNVTPLPIGGGVGGGVDLHRPYIDDIILVSPSGKPMRRELDLIDVWFDSGAMPYAQWHYPFENQEVFKNNFPADFIAEGVDQTRGWFYTLHAIAVMCFDSVAFKNVVSNGLVLDKEGNKMSKSKGNVVDPFDTIATYGADATRWYMLANASPWDNLKFSTDGILETRNKLFGTLYNTYNFFALYANLDGWKHNEQNVLPYENRSELDRWVISKLYSLVAEYRAEMDKYEPTRAARAIETFVDEHLSNWYVRLSRRRFWKGELNEDKEAAYQTLWECLMVTNQLMCSLAPFFSDWMYRNMTAPIREAAKAHNTPLRHDSIHLTDLVQPDASKIDVDLEKRMDYAQRICSLAFSIRKKEKLRVRQPLQKVLLPVLDEAFIAEVDGVKDLILSEINIKELEYITDASGLLKKGAKANFKTLGGKLGKDMKDAAAFIAGFTNEQINTLEKSGTLDVTLNGNAYTLTPDDLVITTEDLPGWKVATDGGLTVALDVTMSDALLAEGIARDLVSVIQKIRKEKEFQVTDRVEVTLEENEFIRNVVAKHSDYIRGETLTEILNFADHFEADVVEVSEDVFLRLDVQPSDNMASNETSLVVTRIWKPIEFSNSWKACDTSILDDISESWKKQREKLQGNSIEYKEFLERLKREHAIETGIVEQMYDLKLGITEALINEGFKSSLLSHDDTNIEPQTLFNHLNDHLEAINWVFDIVKDNHAFSISMINQLHELVTRHQKTTVGRDLQGVKREIPLLKGRFKERENNPTRPDGTKVYYCPPEQVGSEMDKLIELYNQLSDNGVHPLILAAWVHHAFTTIHPYQDGNGRVVRLLASLIFIKAGFFPLTVLREEAKIKYIEALEKADAGLPQQFVNYLAEVQKRNIQKALNVQEVSPSSSFETVQEALFQKIRVHKQSLNDAKEEQLTAGRNKIYSICESYLDSFVNNWSNKLEKEAAIYLNKSPFDNTKIYEPTQKPVKDFYFGQIISYAQKHNYYFNRSMPKAWFILGIEVSESKKYHIGISIHHYGYEDGTLAIGAFLEYKGKNEEDIPNTVLPLAIPPFVVSAYIEGHNTDLNIKQYLEDTLTILLAQIASEL